jgi:hypothetical protein
MSQNVVRDILDFFFKQKMYKLTSYQSQYLIVFLTFLYIFQPYLFHLIQSRDTLSFPLSRDELNIYSLKYTLESLLHFNFRL